MIYANIFAGVVLGIMALCMVINTVEKWRR